MATQTIETVRDLHTWVDEHMGGEANAEIVAAVTEWIHRDDRRPAWGAAGYGDWPAYLDSLDLWHIATGLGV